QRKTNRVDHRVRDEGSQEYDGWHHEQDASHRLPIAEESHLRSAGQYLSLEPHLLVDLVDRRGGSYFSECRVLYGIADERCCLDLTRQRMQSCLHAVTVP